MKRSQRAAARVSLVWLIGFAVLFFVAVALVFLAYDAAGNATRESEASLAKAKEAETRLGDESKTFADVSKAVGWYDRESTTPRTNVEALNSAMAELRTAFPDLGPDVGDLESALPVLTKAYNARGEEISQLKDSISQLESEKETLDKSLRDAIADKDTEIADLRRQLADEGQNKDQQIAELEQRVESLRSQNSEIDAELRTARAGLDEKERSFRDEKALWEARERDTRRVLDFLKEPEAADGSVLKVSTTLDRGWIDIGARNRLARGTRFRVASPDHQRIKAWAEVLETSPDMAEVRFVEVADRFDPVVEGDLVFNPVFDPKQERKAILLGRFSGRFNERELTALLSEMGIKVQSSLDVDTDYLILGSELYVDENGEAYEEPLSPTELPVYKEAESLGVRIVPVKDLYSYFTYQ
jgi:hypothetical protein